MSLADTCKHKVCNGWRNTDLPITQVINQVERLEIPPLTLLVRPLGFIAASEFRSFRFPLQADFFLFACWELICFHRDTLQRIEKSLLLFLPATLPAPFPSRCFHSAGSVSRRFSGGRPCGVFRAARAWCRTTTDCVLRRSLRPVADFGRTFPVARPSPSLSAIKPSGLNSQESSVVSPAWNVLLLCLSPLWRGLLVVFQGLPVDALGSRW